ncbi:hypothetical protein ABZ354_06065 [Streptomyces sp. NPDC005925]|uniref:hypothetical protein n=1 Tax=Streptomyces sp. NPDC005925 TaxID=3157172 RepID=UPI0033FF5446
MPAAKALLTPGRGDGQGARRIVGRRAQKWIRVEFTAGVDRVTVFRTWHDGPPRVGVTTY